MSGQLVNCADVEDCYHKLRDFPFVQLQRGADPDLFRGLAGEGSAGSLVATNAPSYLEPAPNLFAPSRLAPLAWLPPLCGPEGAIIPDRLLFAVGGDVGDNCGRVLFLADHSVFINEMMVQQDNGNVEFSYNCLKYLVDRPGGPRTKVLFVEDGYVNTKFEVPLKEVPDELANRMLDFLLKHFADAEKATPALERYLQSVDERNGFNGAVLSGFRGMCVSPYGLLRVLAFTAAAAVVIYGCYKIGWKARHRSDLQGPLLASALHRLAPAGSVTDQRRQALVRGDNLWEPARHLARQCLASVGAPQGAGPPPVAVRGGWLRRWALAGRVKRLWRLAYGPPVRVPLGEWRRVLRDVRELKAALADGTVQFT
jgi:hypothetical protein